MSNTVWGPVPVLLVQDSMDLIKSVRNDAGVEHGNEFFFSLKLGHISGCYVLRKYANLCGATNPEYLRSSRLRQHIGTVCQVMNLKENEQDILASFMGHDLRVHRECYRLPERTLQLAKVSKVLLQLQQGNLGKPWSWEVMSEPCSLVLIPGNVELDIVTQLCWKFNTEFHLDLFENCLVLFFFEELQFWFVRFTLVMKNRILPINLLKFVFALHSLKRMLLSYLSIIEYAGSAW